MIYPAFVLALLLVVLLAMGGRTYRINVIETVRNLWPYFSKVAMEKEPVGTIEYYRREFNLLTKAVKDRLVLFIDDLDRCECSAAREIMEHINYLVSVGRCYVIMGMAIEPVLKCIQAQGQNSNHLSESEAKSYMRKIVNIEVPVPMLHGKTAIELIDQYTLPTRDTIPKYKKTTAYISKLSKPVSFIIKILLAAVLFTAIAFISQHVLKQYYFTVEPVPINREAVPYEHVDKKTPTTKADKPTPQSRPSQTNKIDDPNVLRGRDQETQPRAWPLTFMALIILSLFFLWHGIKHVQNWPRGIKQIMDQIKQNIEQLVLFLGAVRSTHDSAVFRKALDEWAEVIVWCDTTPRGIKRFLNRVRLMVALEQHRVPSEANKTAIAEASTRLIVAWAALHHVCGRLPEHYNDLTESALHAVSLDGQGAYDFKCRIVNEIIEKTTQLMGEIKNVISQEQVEELWQRFRQYMQGMHIH